MPSNFRLVADWDDVFDPYISGTKPGLTGYRVGGQDVRDRYAPISVGQKADDVNARVDSVDISNFFAKKGTAVYASPTAGLPGLIAVVRTSDSSPLSASAFFTLERNGDTSWSPNNASEWYPNGYSTIGDLYDVEFTLLTTNGIGSLTGSPLGTRLRLSQTRGLVLTVARTTQTAQTGTRSIRVDVFPANSLAVVGTQEIDLSVTADIS